MGDMADDLMDRLDAMDLDCEWCEGCAACDPSLWEDRDGKVYRIKALKTSHLLNILNYFGKHRDASGEKWDSLRAEAIRRGIVRTRKGWKQIAVDKRPPDEKYAGFTKIV